MRKTLSSIVPFRAEKRAVQRPNRPKARPRAQLHPHPRAAIRALPPPALCLDLVNGDRRRRYWIRPSANPDIWYAQVFYGDHQHRGIAGSFHDAERAYGEFQFEIADARLDGWRDVTED